MWRTLKKMCKRRCLDRSVQLTALSLKRTLSFITHRLYLRLRNDLYCVGWGVKLYSLTHLARIAGRSSRWTTAPSFGQPAVYTRRAKNTARYCTAVVRSPWLVRPSGTHWATTWVVRNSASPASVAYWRRIYLFQQYSAHCAHRSNVR